MVSPSTWLLDYYVLGDTACMAVSCLGRHGAVNWLGLLVRSLMGCPQFPSRRYFMFRHPESHKKFAKHFNRGARRTRPQNIVIQRGGWKLT